MYKWRERNLCTGRPQDNSESRSGPYSKKEKGNIPTEQKCKSMVSSQYGTKWRGWSSKDNAQPPHNNEQLDRTTEAPPATMANEKWRLAKPIAILCGDPKPTTNNVEPPKGAQRMTRTQKRPSDTSNGGFPDDLCHAEDSAIDYDCQM